ncbi:MAG: EAL domain-containing protein [Oscillospiraceae bacterium]|nr:EAL domain-containing protein [Oscillospiraceae bacterium]
MEKKRRSRSIYGIVLIPLLIMFLVELTAIIGIPLATGVLRKLNENEEQQLKEHVVFREKQLESAMGGSWSDLDRLSMTINRKAERLLEREQISMWQLQHSDALKEEFLLDITNDLIDGMYIRRVSSIYLMLNAEDLAPLRNSGAMPARSGLCIQNQNPLAAPAVGGSSLRLKRAPVSVVEQSGISKSDDWKPAFVFDAMENPADYDFLYMPFQAAYRASRVENPGVFGYWTLGSSRWFGNNKEHFVTYSQPLVLEDGTVYGVLGVELQEQYFIDLLPHEELVLNDEGTYVLAKTEWLGEDRIAVKDVLVSSRQLHAEDIPADTVLELRGNGARCRINGEKYYADVEPISVYGAQNGYPAEEWMLLGLVKEKDLYHASRSTEYTLGVAVLLMLLVGLAGSVFIAGRLSRPVLRLSAEVKRARQTGQREIPELTKARILEIDEFSDAITELSRDLVNTSSRFLRIIEMASSEVGGFEFCPGEELFITENFLPMLGIDLEADENLTLERVMAEHDRLRETVPWTQWHDGSEVYELVGERGHTRYIKLGFRRQEDSLLGHAEDVTALMAERKRMEHDRDYDFLTGLMNRRAFYREVERIFHSDAKGACGAVVMMDLDDLKKINDKFGHEWGDEYLRKAAWGFGDALPSNAVLARLAGDEFVAVFYGYENEEEARANLRVFQEKIYCNSFVAPDEGEHPVKVSGGIAWYPKDGKNLQELMKYADFALYQVKKGGRGTVSEFDFGSYNEAIYLAQNRQELQRLIEERLVDYHFQPIFNALNGEPYAYEALMRVKLPTLHTPIAVLNLARQENRLRDIELITMERSAECYAALWKKQLVDPNAYLFVNSIADQWLEEKEQARIRELCRGFEDRVVIEITEHNETDSEALQKKKEMQGFSGQFALDDYGTGYNGEKNLLELSPRFVKLDICLVRGLDSDVNKQQIVSNLLTFAHQRDMLVIAEGLETMGEIHKALELGVDLLQGYALARPAAVPAEISEAAMRVIRQFHEMNEKN